MRIGNQTISRIYDETLFDKIVMQSEMQDLQFNGRLSGGSTYLIGSNKSEKFYLTKYKDGSCELWVRRMSGTGWSSNTVAHLCEYEAECIVKAFAQKHD